MNTYQSPQMTLYSGKGNRLYLNASERIRFEREAKKQPIHIANLCLCLLYTGCRLSEAINLTATDIQPLEATISINSLKKRSKVHVREVPIPKPFAKRLNKFTHHKTNRRLWPVNRTTAWRWIKATMNAANINGQQATAKGLRHSFGINAVMNYVPLNVVQKWLGHADMNTTAIYAQVRGPEERKLAERMW